MNRRMTALLLAAALALGLCGMSVFAADPEETAAASSEELTIGETEDAPEETADAAPAEPADPVPEEDGAEEETDLPAQVEVVPDPVGSVSFANLDSRLRENNFNILALEETIVSLESLDYERMQEDLRKALNQIAKAQWTLDNIGESTAASSLQSSYDALRSSFDELKDGELQDDNAAIIRQLENAQDQIVMAAESLYVALVELEMNDQTLDRSLTALDRTIQELELRYDLGQISALTLQTGKAGRTSLVSGQQTLRMNIANYKTQLEMLIGAEQTGAIRLQALPQVTGQQLAAMDLEADLAAAKEASYELFAAGRTLADAKDDYIDGISGRTPQSYLYVCAEHTWEAAQYTYNATIQSYELKFRTLYNQVKDYQQVLEAAKTSLAVEQAEYASMQLKYDQGSISKNKLLDAQDEVSAAQDQVNSAAIDLFSAYNNYRWAVEHGILN